MGNFHLDQDVTSGNDAHLALSVIDIHIMKTYKGSKLLRKGVKKNDNWKKVGGG